MSYCSTLKDYQVENVLLKEATSAPMTDGSNLSLYYEAREELAKRNIDPDQVLRTAGVKKPG